MKRSDWRRISTAQPGMITAIAYVLLLAAGCEELGMDSGSDSSDSSAAGTTASQEPAALPEPPPLNLPPLSGAGTNDFSSMSPEQFTGFFYDLKPNEITDAHLLVAGENYHLVHDVNSLDLRAARVTEKGLRVLSQFPVLENLDLSGCMLAATDWDAVGDLTSLESLTLESAGVGDNSLGFLERLVNLRRLVLKNCNLTDLPFQHMTNLSKLEELDVNGVSQFTGAGMEAFGSKGARAPLKIIRATGTKFGVFGPQNIAGIKTLEEFAAGASGLTDASLASLSGSKQLRVLHIGGNAISDQGLRGLGTFRQLEDIDIAGHPLISDASLGQMRNLKGLVRLNLEGTSCTMNGVATLKKALPDCRIRFMGGEY